MSGYFTEKDVRFFATHEIPNPAKDLLPEHYKYYATIVTYDGICSPPKYIHGRTLKEINDQIETMKENLFLERCTVQFVISSAKLRELFGIPVKLKATEAWFVYNAGVTRHISVRTRSHSLTPILAELAVHISELSFGVFGNFTNDKRPMAFSNDYEKFKEFLSLIALSPIVDKCTKQLGGIKYPIVTVNRNKLYEIGLAVGINFLEHSGDPDNGKEESPENT